MSKREEKAVKFCRYTNAILMAGIAFYFFFIPVVMVVSAVFDPTLEFGGISSFAWRLHRNLTPKYESWAKARLASARAAELSTSNISGTEWPLFGSVFYLWATESLQDAWVKESPARGPAPKDYAKGAIEAATRLVIDPSQANWVKIHWGDKYLRTENVFYRMLVISALTSHARLTGDRQYLPMLQQQADSLAAELDASPLGLLDDYPGQCYPGDVLTAVAMIQRADGVLGTDHSAFVKRALRAFEGPALDPRGLVPYSSVASSGFPTAPTRGCGNSYVSLFAPEIWPAQARKWYDLYAQHFWQEAWTCAGFREFPKDLAGKNWYMDVDAGPVLKGFGCAACAFGVGAARVNGHLEQARPLAAEMLAVSYPLPNGTLLLPRLLSNAADAPYLGEAAILFNLTRQPAAGVSVKTGGSIPVFVWIFLMLQVGAGFGLWISAVRSVLRLALGKTPLLIQRPGMQIIVWSTLILLSIAMAIAGKPLVAGACLLLALFFPRVKRLRAAAPPAIQT